MITTKKEARKIAVAYWASHYGNMTNLDGGEYLDDHYAFLISSHYPIWNKETKEVERYLEMEKLGEIVIHNTGAIVSPTPREAVLARIKKHLKESRSG